MKTGEGRGRRRRGAAVVRFDNVTACGEKGGKGRWRKEGGDVMFTDLFLILSLAPVSPAFVPHVFCLISLPRHLLPAICSCLLSVIVCRSIFLIFICAPLLCLLSGCGNSLFTGSPSSLSLLSFFFPPPSPAPALLLRNNALPHSRG